MRRKEPFQIFFQNKTVDMLLLKLCYTLLFASISFLPAFTNGNPRIITGTPDSILSLKRKCQVLWNENKYQEAYPIFIDIANYYDEQKNQRMYFDYRNKASNCFSKFGDPLAALDTVFHLYKNYSESSLNDPHISKAIIDNFIENNTNILCYPTKLAYLDLLSHSFGSKLPDNSHIDLHKERVLITKMLSKLPEQLNSYYSLLNHDLVFTDKIKYELELGILYSDNKEYQLSNIVLLSLLSCEKTTPKDNLIIYNLIANNYLQVGKYSLSYYFYNQSLLLRNRINSNNDYKRVISNNLANYFSTIKKIDSARIFYENSLRISITEFGSISHETAFQYNNLGNFYFIQNKFDTAFHFYSKSFEIKNSIDNYNDRDIIHSLYNLGRTKLMQRDFSSAVLLLEKSIIKNFELAKIYSLENGLISPDDYIISCNILGELYYEKFREFHNKVLLDSAKIYFEQAISTNDSIINSAPLESSKIINNHLNSSMIENYLQCHLSNGSIMTYPEENICKFTAYFDKKHNYVLFSKIANKYMSIGGCVVSEIDNDFLDQMYYQIEHLENDRTSSLHDLFELNNNLFSTIKKIKENDSYKTIDLSNIHIDNIKELQTVDIRQRLKPNTAILEYTTIKDTLYCILATRDAFTLTKIGNSSTLRSQVSKCVANIKQFSIDFNQLYDLSNILLAPIDNLSEQISNIVVIKDENNMSIPFDVLLLAEPMKNQQNNKYLIDRYNISYSYSLNLILSDELNKERTYEYDFVGFAPTSLTSFDQNNFSTITGSKAEVSEISRLFAGSQLKVKVLLGTEANSQNFSQLVGKTKILHIASHSLVSNQSNLTGIILNSSTDTKSKNIIDYFSILGLHQGPDIVTIASCASNTGKIIDGEGIQNLGRAFSTIGASSIISSEFRLDDEFSNLFMCAFYNRLLLTKDIKASLCETKREFIRNKTYSYPTYWSNFNLTEK